MRVFLALMPDKETMALLDSLCLGVAGRYCPEDWHMTLCFLGEFAEVNLKQLIDELDETVFEAVISWQATSLRMFPIDRHAKTWALQSLGTKDISQLLERVEGLDALKGFNRDYPFIPHVSLAEQFNPVKPVPEVTLRFDRLAVMQSLQATKRPKYRPLRSWMLG